RCQDLRTQSRVTEKPPETLISGDTPQYPSPEANFSTKGRLVEDNGSYIFELFHYTHQVNIAVYRERHELQYANSCKL
ncbi:hypothetical protein GBAR_LOCUS8553, partial [Geodia barretti]